MIKSSLIVACTGFGLMLAMPAIANAGFLIAPDGLLPHTDDNFFLEPSERGFQFTTLTDITLSALGWTDTDDGIQRQAHSVGLWVSDGTLLRSVVITPLSPQTGTATRMSEIIPITLMAGNAYVLAGTLSQEVAPDGLDVVGTFSHEGEPPEPLSFTEYVDPRISFDGARWINNSGELTFPSNATKNQAFLGPNAEFASVNAVPEPSSLTLLCLAAVCFGGYGWRRRMVGGRSGRFTHAELP